MITGVTAPESAPARFTLPRVPVHGVAIAVLCGLTAATYIVFALRKLALYRVASYDLVVFDQAVRGYSKFGTPTIPIRGVNLGRGFDYSQLADHFSPILATLAPLYWIHDGPATLVVAQAVLFALAIPSIWLFTRRRLGTGAAYLVCVAYALSWPLAQAVAVDFHEAAFAPLLTALAIDRLDARRYLPGLLATGALLLVKEDMGLLVLGIGLWLIATRRWRLGLVLVSVGGLALELVRKVLIPLAGGNPDEYWRFSKLGANLPEAAGYAVTHPFQTLWMFLDENGKWDTIGMLLWPTLCLCLLSPITLAALPELAERFLGDTNTWWSTGWHYDAFTVSILFMAGVDGAVRLAALLKRPEVKLIWATAACVVAITIVPYRPLDQLMYPGYYQADPKTATREEAMRLIPDGVVVETTDDFGPAMTDRTTVLWWDYQHRGTPWLIVSAGESLRGVIDDYVKDGYQLLFDRDEIIVLKKI